VNYDYFPSKEFPILVYFKETQTPEEKWGEGPGGLDKKGGGQVKPRSHVQTFAESVPENSDASDHIDPC
jgi:hypothetical protein